MAVTRFKLIVTLCTSTLVLTTCVHVFFNHGITKSFNTMFQDRPGPPNSTLGSAHRQNRTDTQNQVVHIAFTACGRRCVDESGVMVKSAILLTRSTLFFHIFTEKRFTKEYNTMFDSIQRVTGKRAGYTFYDMLYHDTPGFTAKEWGVFFWKQWFCAGQRLFYPRRMNTVDAVLYVDTDTLFLTPPENIWHLFEQFNCTQIAGLAPEATGKPSRSWYERLLKFPHYGLKGLNSGVMLMNLTSIRSLQWEESLTKYAARYKEHTILPDQDLLNIYFHYHPEQLFLCPCETNYRPSLCQQQLMCDRPAHILHGNARAWHSGTHAPFSATYKAFREFSGPPPTLPMLVEKAIKKATKSNNARTSNCSEYVYLFVDELYNT